MNPRTRIEQYQNLVNLRRQGPLPAEARAALNDERLSILEIRALADRVFGDEAKAEAAGDMDFIKLVRPRRGYAILTGPWRDRRRSM